MIVSQLKSSVSKISGSGRKKVRVPWLRFQRRIETAVRLGGSAALLDRSLRRAADVLLEVTLAVAQDLDPHLGAQRVHHARADAVEAAGDLVAAPAELAAGVELGHDHLERALPGPVPVDRDAAPVVDHLERAVRVDGHVDPGRLVGHRLVDAVVDDLPDELMQAAAIGRADVHARAHAHGLEALENLDVLGGVARRRFAACPRRSLDGHADGSSSWSGVDRDRGIGGRFAARAAGDDRVEPVELLVGVEVDDEPAAAPRAHDADLGGEQAAQLRLEVLEVVAERRRAGGRLGAPAANELLRLANRELALEHDCQDRALELRAP